MKFASCEEVEPLLPVLVDAASPAAPERALVEQHITSCPSCQEAKDEFRAVGNVLRRHFAWRAASDVTAGVIRDLEDEVTLASLPVGKPESIDDMKGRIKALRGPAGVVPNERSEMVTNVTPARPGVTTAPAADGARGDGSRYLIGQVLGGYRVDAEIAKGGMGVVYRATQLSMDRVVALKVLSSRLAQDETFKKRFIREAKAAATIDHPNVIRVYDAGEDRGETFFAMEFVPGDDAETVVLKTGPIETMRAAEIGLAVARALEAAHRLGIVHRDVKPANVLIPARGGVKLADLGLAKYEEGAGGDGQLTLRKTVMGSPNYMSPEQARDAREVDARSDVYSLGATLYHIVAGERPWGGGSTMDIMARVLGPAPLALPELAANETEIDPAMRAIVARACSKDRAQRHPNMTALREELEAFLKGEPVPPPSGITKRKGRTSGALPAVEGGKRRKPTSESSRRTVEAGPSGRRVAAPGRGNGSARALVLMGAIGAIGIVGVVLKKAMTTEVPPEVAPDRPTDGDGLPSARTSPTPAGVSSRSTPAAPSSGDERDAAAYKQAVIDSDRQVKLEHLVEGAQILETFAREHPASKSARLALNEAAEIHGRIAQRLMDALADARQRESRQDVVGADEVLSGVEQWGDDAAKTRAADALAALRARAAKSVPGLPVQERPSPSPEASAPSPDPVASPVARPTPSPSVVAGPAPSPGAPLTGDELLALQGLVKGKLEVLSGGRVRLIYDFQSAAQADDWTPAPLEPAWLREAFEPLPSAPVPAPWDQQAAWSAARGALLGTGWRRRRTQFVFAGDSLKIDVKARLLAGRNLVVTCGDPAKPFVVGCGLHLSDSPFPKDAGRTKEEQVALAAIHKGWKEWNRPTLVVARERSAFEWIPTGYPVPLKELSSKGTQLTIELIRDDDGDSLVARCDADRPCKVALGKSAFAAGPVGLEVLGRPVAFETITLQGSVDPSWARGVLQKK